MTIQLFKWLMALVVMVCVPMLLEVVGRIRKTDVKHSEDYLRQRVEGIYAEVALFYNRLGEMKKAEGLEPTKWPDFDRLFCSDDWNRKMTAVLQKEDGSRGREVQEENGSRGSEVQKEDSSRGREVQEEDGSRGRGIQKENGSQGEMPKAVEIGNSREGDSGFFSWNYWICGTENNFVYANNVEVIDHTGDQGTVSLILHNGQMAVPVLLNMVFERGDWYIDEITNSWNHHPRYPYFEWKQEMQKFIS